MTIATMLQVEPIDTRTPSDTRLDIPPQQQQDRHKDGRQQGSKRSNYHHPHAKNHSRLKSGKAEAVEQKENTEANDPFEKHFLSVVTNPPKTEHVGRSASFRNEKPRPKVAKRDPDLSSGGNYSSVPNLLFPKDDMLLDVTNHDPRDQPLRRVRSFKTTPKGGVLNRGDSFRKKSSSRNLAKGSTVENGQESPKPVPAAIHGREFVCGPPQIITAMPSYFKVQLLGAPGCGKTSITNQFMSSDWANAYDSMNVDDAERTVTIQLDGEEATMEFNDALEEEDSVESDIDVAADAYVVVYSITDRVTFDAAVQTIYSLRHGMGTDRPIVLVGNKIDLVRKRRVKKQDALSISRTYDTLHCETSAALNHHVDELLVAILKQIRYKLNPNLFPQPKDEDRELLMKRRDSKGPKGFVVRLFRRLSKRFPK